MIAIRTLFAAVMAIMVATSGAASSSSSSTGASGSLSSSSGPIIPGVNDSSSSDIWIVSSSSTGADGPTYLPYGSYEVSYSVEVASGIVAAGLADALAHDFASTLANNTVYNTTANVIYPYIRVNIDSGDSFTIQSFTAQAATNVTANAWILNNVTNVLSFDAENLAQTFAAAARAGQVYTTEAAAYNVNIYPQEVTVTMAPVDPSGPNGASSVASASLLIGSMIAALALAL